MSVELSDSDFDKAGNKEFYRRSNRGVGLVSRMRCPPY